MLFSNKTMFENVTYKDDFIGLVRATMDPPPPKGVLWIPDTFKELSKKHKNKKQTKKKAVV